MSTIQNWSTTAASNTSIDGIDIAENCSPANLNNAQRSAMANIAALRDLMGAKAVTGGSADAQTLTSGLSLSAYQQGLLIGFEAGFTNTGATTLNVDSLGAIAVRNTTGAALTAGMITAGGIYLVAYETGAGVFVLLNPSLSTAGLQPLDSDLTAIAGLSPSNDDVIQRKAGAWVNRTLAQLIADLAALGTTFQPLDADLTALAAVATAAYGRGLLTYSSEANFKAGVNLEAGVDFPPIPTSSTLPVGWSGFMRYTGGSSLSNGDTTSGSNVQTPGWTGSFGTTGLSVRTGDTQTGTWRNIAGFALSGSGDAGNQFGLMVRTV